MSLIINPYVFAAGGGGSDPYFANVKALLHCDGTNGSTTFTDVTGKTWAPDTGTPQISTSQYKFGGASGSFSSANLTCTHSDFSSLGGGDFTLETWVYANSLASARVLFCMGDNSTNYWQCMIHPSAGLIINIFGSNILSQGNMTGLSTGVWMHIAFVRSGNNLYGFVDGASSASSGSGASMPSITSNKLYFASNNTPAGFMDGYLDDIRITGGVARYTSGFTPPSSAFPDS